ncbi:VCBS repeat-containing protein, partial [Aminobacter lissarensis]
PVADNDANSVTEGLGHSTSGNVFGAAGASAGDDADTIGADGAAAGGAVTRAYFGLEANAGSASYTTISGATVIAGTYGDLTLNPDGTYSYTLKTASIPAGVTNETFTYEIKDGDGDTDLAQLVIGLTQDQNVPETTGSVATVYEDGLADGVQHGAASETQTGTFTVDGNNEGYTLQLNGQTISAVNDTVTTSNASAGDDADTIGADGAAAGGAVTRAYFGLEANAGSASYTTISGATVIAGTYGDLTLNPDGTYSYTLKTASIPAGVTNETFTYEIKDGDGDTDLAQLVIGLTQDQNVPETTGSVATVYEDGLADGVQHGAASETQTGTFTVDGNNEGYTLQLNGQTISAVNDTVTTSKGVLTITSISAPDAGGVVTYGYSYTLSAALTHTGQGEVNPLSDTITMSVTDATGDSDTTPASIVISIVDDIPV